MKQENYKWILYSITLVILGTIGIQVYWNYKNYESNKQEYMQDIQHTLDESIEEYYANLAKKKSTFTATLNDSNALSTFGVINDALDNSVALHIFNPNSTSASAFPSHPIKNTIDSLTEKFGIPERHFPVDSQKIMIIKEEFTGDSVPDSLQNYLESMVGSNGYIDISIEEHFQMLTSQIVISLTNDSLNLYDVNTILKSKLKKKNMDFEFQLYYKNPHEDLVIENGKSIKTHPLSVSSESVYLPEESQLKLSFSDIKYPVLKRIYLGILISTILILGVIFCLFYLLKIIQRQKQLSEIKNDFISNITHEFKTPIATISVALESIRNFNASQHPERSETYLDMSKEQLDKLTLMVEKLLETATLDSNNIELVKEEIDLVHLIKTVQHHHKLNTTKHITFSSNANQLKGSVDAFHFENVINNLVDNAIKYGGDQILIELKVLGGLLEVYIKDSGKSLTKTNTEHLFEKFYRQPTGNTHDVKGFGIGLYYSKKIIEKHNGQLTLSFDKDFTIFKISIPYE